MGGTRVRVAALEAELGELLRHKTFWYAFFTFLFRMEFHRFLMELSVLRTDTAGLRSGAWSNLFWKICGHVYLPGSSLEISAQRFPSTLCAWQMIWSSSSVHLSFFTAGFRWLCQRSRHCFPLRVWMYLAMSDQCFTPYFWTSLMTCTGSYITLLWCLTGGVQVCAGLR